MNAYRLEHLFSYTGTLQAPAEIIGATPEGIRANFHITGGDVVGPKLKGRLRSGGIDAFFLRRDGIGTLDVRTSIETDDGARVYLSYLGQGDLGNGGYEGFQCGELPARLPLRTAPVMRSAHPAYSWLQRLPCIGIGEVDLERFVAAYDVYAVH